MLLFRVGFDLLLQLRTGELDLHLWHLRFTRLTKKPSLYRWILWDPTPKHKTNWKSKCTLYPIRRPKLPLQETPPRSRGKKLRETHQTAAHLQPLDRKLDKTSPTNHHKTERLFSINTRPNSTTTPQHWNLNQTSNHKHLLQQRPLPDHTSTTKQTNPTTNPTTNPKWKTSAESTANIYFDRGRNYELPRNTRSKAPTMDDWYDRSWQIRPINLRKRNHSKTDRPNPTDLQRNPAKS